MIIRYGDYNLFNTKTISRFLGSFKTKKRLTGIEINKGLLPEGGRSSVDTSSLGDSLSHVCGGYDIVTPTFPVDVLKYISLLAVVNADLSQAVKNAQLTGNTGHKLLLSGSSDSVVEAALNRLNGKAASLYERSAGIDGLVNHLFNQLMISGAISAEAVIADDAKGVDQVVIVPSFSIRFRPEKGRYLPYQLPKTFATGTSLIPLSTLTYKYFALNVMDNSPYAIPPFLSALEALVMQKEIFKNIKYMLHKFGLLGLNIVTVDPLPPKKGENIESQSYIKRNQDHIKNVADSIAANYSKGILVVPKGWDLKNHALTQDARGVTEIIKEIEMQIFSGIGSDPAMHGRSYSTTETYATVIHGNLVNAAGNMRRLIKGFMEHVYLLDLALGGIPVDGIALKFNKDRRLNPNTEALADRYILKNTMDMVNAGMISPDDGAQYHGKNGWYDQTKIKDGVTGGSSLRREFHFDQDLQRYEFRRPVHHVHRLSDSAKADDAERDLQKWVVKYLADVQPFFNELESQEVISWAVNYIDENIEALSLDSSEFYPALRDYLKSFPSYKEIKENEEFHDVLEKRIVDAAKYYKEVDLSVFGDNPPSVDIRFGEGDLLAAQMHQQCDAVYFSRFLDNKTFGPEIRAYIQKFLERGESAFSGWTEEIEKEFREKFGAALSGDLFSQMRLIVQSCIGRIQTYSRIEQLHDGGFDKAKIIEFDGCCEICAEMDGKEFSVTPVRDAIQESFVNAADEDTALEFIKSTTLSKDDSKLDIDDLIAMGKGFPKFHPHCRGTVEGVFE